ncbi:MAG TPA: hypothetical protein VIC85_10330 [Ktedonobacterales bacterium]|jgi:predicted GH43/DUF377 family glycosyl hydrolase
MRPSTQLSPWRIRRLGVVMESDQNDPREVEGALNPAATRGPDGQLYLLPRLVAAGNYSRIGLARVLFDRHGIPRGVERLGVVLEPTTPYELNPWTGGGVEDPRVTYFAARQRYVMTYAAYGPDGPRVAAAVSRDLSHWRRLGLVRFAPERGINFDALPNKDALLFPEPVPAPDGRPALALIHRPVRGAPMGEPWLGESPLGESPCARPQPWAPCERPGIWISYAPLADIAARRHVVFGQHHRLVAPERSWERLKVGGGTPPIRFGHDWLILYHGVAGHIIEGIDQQPHVRYSAGLLVVDGRDPRRVLYRSARSILTPRTPAEREGIVPRVVFPTGLDTRPDGALDIYYGMADSRIGVARLSLLDTPPAALARVA